MKLLLVISYFTLGIFCFIAAISMYRYKKRLPTLEKEKLSKGLFPWWYYVGVIILAVLMLGPFDEILRLIGFILFFVVVCLGWKWKLNRR